MTDEERKRLEMSVRSIMEKRNNHVTDADESEVIAAVATLPRRLPQTLPAVQKWLCDVLALFADDIDPQQGNLTLLEAVVFCCIHTRCEAAKSLIVRIYSKYKMPNVMIPGGK